MHGFNFRRIRVPASRLDAREVFAAILLGLGEALAGFDQIDFGTGKLVPFRAL